MKNNKFFLIISTPFLCLSSCKHTVTKFSKIIKDNVRYIETKDCYYADCFVITPSDVVDGVCTADFHIHAWENKDTRFGRDRFVKFLSNESNSYDTFSIPSKNPGICFRLDNFELYNYVPTQFVVRLFVDRPLSYQFGDIPFIMFWIPNCPIRTNDIIGCLGPSYFRLEIFFWDGYSPIPSDSKYWDTNRWSFDFITLVHVDFVDAPIGEKNYD